MIRLPIFAVSLCLLAASFAPGATPAADPARRNVVDYFLLLPADCFEGPPATWLRFLRQPKCGLVDLANGYLSCIGDGAQPAFEVALFRYRDGRPLLAICSGELEGANSLFLNFFELGPDGKMKPARRSLLRVKDAGDEERNWRFELPRQGRTLLVRKQRGGEILRRFTWTGEKFQEEK